MMFALYKTENLRTASGASREAFDRLTTKLHGCDELSQMVAGNSINVANSEFLLVYTSPEAFMRLPLREQRTYLNQLTAGEHELSNGEPEAALGVGLFKMWIGALISKDHGLIECLSDELRYFGEKGDLTQCFW